MSDHITPKAGAGMNNLDKVSKIIHHMTGDLQRAHDVTHTLADAGLLAHNLPEPTTIADSGRGAAWVRGVPVWVEDGSDRVWSEFGDMSISCTVESARKHAYALLAAARFAEKNQEGWPTHG